MKKYIAVLAVCVPFQAHGFKGEVGEQYGGYWYGIIEVLKVCGTKRDNQLLTAERTAKEMLNSIFRHHMSRNNYAESRIDVIVDHSFSTTFRDKENGRTCTVVLNAPNDCWIPACNVK